MPLENLPKHRAGHGRHRGGERTAAEHPDGCRLYPTMSLWPPGAGCGPGYDRAVARHVCAPHV